MSDCLTKPPRPCNMKYCKKNMKKYRFCILYALLSYHSCYCFGEAWPLEAALISKCGLILNKGPERLRQKHCPATVLDTVLLLSFKIIPHGSIDTRLINVHWSIEVGKIKGYSGWQSDSQEFSRNTKGDE